MPQKKKHVRKKSRDSSVDFKQFRVAAEYAPTHIIFTDTEGKIFYANPAAEKITGYSKEEMMGQRPSLWGNLMPKPFYEEFWHTIKDKHEVFHGKLQNKRKTGELYDAEIWVSPVLANEKLQGFVGVELDISETAELAKKLAENTQLFDNLTMNSQEVFFLFDPLTKHPTYISPGYERIWGKPLDPRAYTAPDAWMEGILPEDKEMIAKIVQSEVTRPTLEFRIQRPDGKIRTLESKTFAVTDPSGAIKSFAGLISDITERKEAERKLKEFSSLQTHVLDILAHQLRTPLTAIRWNLELVMGSEFGKLNEAHRGFARVTHMMSTEIISRVGDLLLAVEIEQKPVSLNKSEGSLESLVASVVGEMSSVYDHKNISVRFIAPSKPLSTIQIDVPQIRKVIWRMLDNSVNYTKAGGHVEVAVSEKKNRIRFEISDNGIGIPASEQARIFTRFYRASNALSMKADASGIGLFLSKYFIERHGGTIGFTSVEGQGSTFWFELPLA